MARSRRAGLVLALRAAACCAAVAATLLAAAPLGADPPGEVVVVADLEVGPYRVLLEGFRKACALPVRVVPADEAAAPGFEQRLQASGARGVLAVGLQARAAVEGLRTLPVLLAMVPQVEPWVAARANRLGIEMALSPRQHLETIRRVFPRARRVGVVFDPAQSGAYAREAEKAVAGLGVTLVARGIARPAELAGRLAELRGQVDVLWLLPDPTVLQGPNLDLLLLTSFEARLPLYGFARKYAELGAVAAAHLDPAAMGAQAAALLDCPPVLPADPALRWEYARGARLVLNEKVARKMGLALDPAVLETADDVLR